jgi:uncharacterized protein (DUF58 family)
MEHTKSAVSDILKKVRELEIKSKKLTSNIFSGEYHSAFKGRGMSFKEVREYAAGDDIRFIDWNTSARFGHPFSKVFEEERELTVMLLLDCSASNLAGSHTQQKKELIIEMAAILAFSAISNNDKVGALLFTDQTELFIPPKKGKEHVLYIVREMLSAEPSSKRTDISEAIRFFNQTLRQKGIVFLISDFETDGYTKALKTVARRHDCIAIQVHDRVEYNFPNAGLVPVQDAETEQIVWVDSSDAAFRDYWNRVHQSHINLSEEAIKRSGWDYIRFETGEDYVKLLQGFFIKRIKR